MNEHTDIGNYCATCLKNPCCCEFKGLSELKELNELREVVKKFSLKQPEELKDLMYDNINDLLI